MGTTLRNGLLRRLAAALVFALAPWPLGQALVAWPQGQALAQPAAVIDPVRFAVIGDFGQAGPSEAAVAALVRGWNPDFVVTVGDNNYPLGQASTIDANIGQYYHDYIGAYAGEYGRGAAANRFFPALGNHDWYTPGAQPYLDYFTLPGNERYYDVPWGSVHLFVIDSDSAEPDGIGPSSAQARWLQAALARSDRAWKLVVLHHAPYSSGPHGSNVALQWPYAQWGASAVLAGHDHDYERLDIGGLPYFVNGLGGSSRYGFGTPVEGSQVRYRDDYGALLVTADCAQITYQFVTRQGQVVDTFSLQRDCALRLPGPYRYHLPRVSVARE